jgi:transposase
MSRYRKPQQRSFNDIEVGMSSLPIRPGCFEVRFREVCDSVIPDSIFDKLYSSVGREARSPSVLTRLLLLQLRDGTSDERIVDDLYYDLRVRHMCDFAVDQRPIHPTNLVYHRLRLLFGTIKRDEIEELKGGGFSEKDSPLQEVFERIKQAAIALGLVDTEAAQLIDSTAIFGRAAVMDSYALIFAGIRKALDGYQRSDDEHARELASRLRRSEYLSDVAKPRIDWESEDARQELLNDLVYDAVSVLRAGLHFEDMELQGLLEQLARLVGQDVEVSEDGTGKLIDGVCADRQVSVVDPEMRHGRKSKSRKFNGYKGTVTADATSGVITAVHVMAANEHDSTAVVPIIEQQECIGTVPPALIGDRAYAAEDARYGAMSQGVAIVTKPNISSAKGLSKSDFEIDTMGGTVTCPSGFVRAIGGQSVTFMGRSCPMECPHRRECLGKSGKHVIKLRNHEALQQDAEKFAQTDRGKELLLLRPAIERVIAHWMRNGARQARYFGRLKVWLQCVLSAIMCNVKKIADKTEPNGPNDLDFAADRRLNRFLLTVTMMVATVISVVATYLESTRPHGPGATYTFGGSKKTISSGAS